MSYGAAVKRVPLSRSEMDTAAVNRRIMENTTGSVALAMQIVTRVYAWRMRLDCESC